MSCAAAWAPGCRAASTRRELAVLRLLVLLFCRGLSSAKWIVTASAVVDKIVLVGIDKVNCES